MNRPRSQDLRRSGAARSAARGIRTGLRVLGLAFLAALAACGGESSAPDGPSAPPPFQRLDLRPLEARPVEATAVPLQSFEIAAEFDAWVAEAMQVLRLPILDPPPSEDVPSSGLVLRSGRDHPAITLERRGRYDPATFNRVSVGLAFRGNGQFHAEVLRGGRRIMVSSEPAQLMQHTAPYVVDLDLLRLDASDAPGDVLRLVFPGGVRELGLLHVELQRAPLSGRLPDAAGPPRMIALGGEGRSGEELLSGRPLGVRFVAPPDGVLSWSWGQSDVLGRLSAPAELLVSVARPGEEPLLSHRVPIAFGEGWRSARLELPGLDGAPLEATFALEVEEEDGEAACAVAEVSVWAPGSAPPAVLLITTDTHRGDHLGVAAGELPLDTPVLDALAARGVLFEDCLAPTNVTNPSHVAIMTGLHPRDTGVIVNHRPLADAAETLAEVYREAGWRTFAVLSTRHLGHEGSGLGQGFDRMSWPSGPPRSAGASIDVLEAWLAEAEGVPLFVWLHVFDAHWPYEPPEDFDRRYYPRDKDPRAPLPPGVELAFDPAFLPGDLQDVTDLEYPRAQYRAEIAYLDGELGRVLHAERFARAVVAVVADHGEGLGESDVFFDHVGLTWGTLHVPFLLSWPEGPRGLRVPQPVTPIDLPRTLLDLSGLADVPFPGRNLQDVIAGRRAPEPRFQLAAAGKSASVQFGDLFLVLTLERHRYRTSARLRERHQVELYDLSIDRACRDDLVDARPAAAAALRARLVAWLQGARAAGLASAPIQDAELVEQLAQLGYAEHDPGAGTIDLWVEDDCAWCLRWP